MELYIIGAMITMGFLFNMDMHESAKSKGFKGMCRMIFIISIWPFALGSYLYTIVEEYEAKTED